ETAVDEFAKLKFAGDLQSIRLEDAVGLCARQGKALVCDVKGMGIDYEYAADCILQCAKTLGCRERVVLQCYKQSDFELAQQIGFKRVILPVWKHFYRDPLGDDAFQFLQNCVDMDPSMVV